MLKRSRILVLLAALFMVLISASCVGAGVEQWYGASLSRPSDVFAGNVETWYGDEPVSVDLFEEGDVLSIDVYADMMATQFSWNPTTRLIDVVLLRTIDQAG